MLPSDDAPMRPIMVAGAGSIGCFVGGLLADAGRAVVLLARPRLIATMTSNGLRLTDFEGMDRLVSARSVILSEDPSLMARAAFVLVTVKSRDTATMAELIARHAPPDAIVVSLQNGVDNVPILREHLPKHRVLAGMVAFNVVASDAAHFHRGTSGGIVIEQDTGNTAAKLAVPGLAVTSSGNMHGIQWGKLLLNLNNALNALSNLPLREQLSHRAWRAILAQQMSEALVAMRAAGIAPVTGTPLPPALLPAVLRLPDVLFRVLAARMLKIDPQARSSMWEDLQHGRQTEIDQLQGAIIQLARRHTLAAPLSERITGLVKSAEAAQQGSPALQPSQIRLMP